MEQDLRLEMEKVRRAIDAELRRIRAEKSFPLDLYEATFHLLLSGGKRIRPFLTVKTAQMFDSEFDAALPPAVAVELLHNFTLIHDDIMDRDEFRRGVPTTHVIWGDPTAIAAGDALFSLLFSYVVSEMRRRRIDPSVIVSAVEILSKGAETICGGQIMDLLAEKYVSTESEYIEMVYMKTATLFRLSSMLGGIVGGADETQKKHLDSFGRNIGISFQIVDDVLGIMGRPEVTGKPVGSDLKQGKNTLILIHALKNSSENGKMVISSVFGNKEAKPVEVEGAIDLILNLGSVDFARRMAKQYMEEAIDSLRKLPKNVHRDSIESLACFIYARER